MFCSHSVLYTLIISLFNETTFSLAEYKSKPDRFNNGKASSLLTIAIEH